MSPRRLQNAIDNPTLELKIISASDVSHIDTTEKIDAYAVVSINGDNTQKKQSAKTPIDYDGGSNPTWNHTVKFSVNEERAREGLLTVYIKLYSYWLEDENDIYLGEVNVLVQDLLASNALPPFSNGNVNKMKPVTYPITFIGETKPNEKLSLSYRFKPVPVKDLYPPPPEPVYLPPFGPATSGQPIIYSPHQCQTTQTTGQAITVTKLAIELVIKSANNIRNVNVFDDMDVYAYVMICDGKTTKVKQKTKTPIAYSGFIFPTWNHAVKFCFDEEELAGEDSLVVELMSHRPIMGDKHIGKVNVRIQELIGLKPPSPLTDVKLNSMKLVTHKVRGEYGEKGTLSFTYRFLEEKVTVPIVPGTTPQPIIMYIPIPHQSDGSANPVHGTPGYMAVHTGANIGPSNGLVPIYMPPPYHPQGYQQYSQRQPQQQPQPQPQPQFQSQPQQQPQPQPQPPQRPTQTQAQVQGARPQVKPQGGSVAALGLGAAVLGRVIGGALMSEMMSDELNTYEAGA
ncbi:hypothetical protein EUTSA_v10024954mg [Eutrema salsugineum]|uniref:C2 domain-containing protein n=1 Tax=Eutrema salsugineum TaxID=72664 RepID=V4LYY8_EUTSA|nr:protein SRC2 [Eutrema salsugineum]ESQ55910.1 hypothetical protein EUTSA_v10024954mg [Eutrema salsugineum]